MSVLTDVLDRLTDITTLRAQVTELIGWEGYLVLGGVTLCLLHWAWWAADEIGQIYYPPLAEKLRERGY